MRYIPSQEAYLRMTTEELRTSFMLNDLFLAGKVTAVWAVGTEVPDAAAADGDSSPATTTFSPPAPFTQ